MADMVKILSNMGVDFSKTDRCYYKFQSTGFMDLIIETWEEDEWLHVRMAHCYTQQGDLMVDPEVEFRIIKFQINGKCKWRIQPIHYKQDNMGIYQKAMIFGENGQIRYSPKLQKEIREFLTHWTRNIKNRKYLQVN